MSKHYTDIINGLTEAIALERLEIIKDIPPDRLRELASADREGRVVVLPCKVGDMVYMLKYPTYIGKDGKEWTKLLASPDGFKSKAFTLLDLDFRTGRLRDDVYVTEAEAAAALAEKG